MHTALQVNAHNYNFKKLANKSFFNLENRILHHKKELSDGKTVLLQILTKCSAE